MNRKVNKVSNKGRILSIERRARNGMKIKLRIKKISRSGQGYGAVNLYLDGVGNYHLVHRLVGMAFIPNPENKPCINHKDGNPQNNHVDNLEWVTYSENTLHAYRIGLFPNK